MDGVLAGDRVAVTGIYRTPTVSLDSTNQSQLKHIQVLHTRKITEQVRFAKLKMDLLIAIVYCENVSISNRCCSLLGWSIIFMLT